MNIYTNSTAYQGTAQIAQVTVDPVYQICAVNNLNASSELQSTFWINKNGDRMDSDLGNASYEVIDKNGNSIAGLSQTGIAPGIDGHYRISPVSAAALLDLAHYVMKITITADNKTISGSIGIVVEE